MKEETVRLIDRPYGDLVSDLLTAIVGGVVNEPINFDIRTLAYPLAEPSNGVRSISGKVDGESVSTRDAVFDEVDYDIPFIGTVQIAVVLVTGMPDA